MRSGSIFRIRTGAVFRFNTGVSPPSDLDSVTPGQLKNLVLQLLAEVGALKQTVACEALHSTGVAGPPRCGCYVGPPPPGTDGAPAGGRLISTKPDRSRCSTRR